MLFDLNGTLAQNGTIADTTRERLIALSADLKLSVISADTHGTFDSILAGLPVRTRRVEKPIGAGEKREFLDDLGAQSTIAVGNGRNDVAMLEAAALGIVIAGVEGAAKEALLVADVVYASIDDALDSLLNPQRLVASLRG